MIDPLALGCAAAATAGLIQAVASTTLLHRLRLGDGPSPLPPITVLKPLCGDEPLLEPALASFCEQDYPEFQLVFGVQNPADPALAVVERLRERYPAVAISVVVDRTWHGRNGKIGNLINMLPAACHDVLVVADSDIHAAPDTLRRVAAALAEPGVGLATALYTGLPASASLAGRLGAAHINHSFLPGALLARSLGRQDCLGAIMALRRETLEQIGGFEALVEHVADDALLGRLVRAQGLEIALIDAIPATTVPETTLPDLIGHELRWARTVRSIAPVGFALGAIQYPMFWAALCVMAGSGAVWTWVVFLVTWLLRNRLARLVELRLGAAKVPFWLLPIRDILSVGVLCASYRSNRVAWRGQEHSVVAFARPSLELGGG